MWLVFRDEGVSLRHYLYTEREAAGFVLHGQSNFWRDMRLDPKGPEVCASSVFAVLWALRLPTVYGCSVSWTLSFFFMCVLLIVVVQHYLGITCGFAGVS